MSDHSPFSFQPIGYIKTCYPDKFGVPRQSGLVQNTISELEIKSEWQPESALQGLSGYSHVWLVFVFHLNQNTKYHPKVHPPRLEGESIGVFATRSPHRPNPIGLSLCEIKEIQKNKIILSGVDLVDGTPILDIKPYLPQFESHPEAKGGWATDKQMLPIEVIFTAAADEKLNQWMINSQRQELRSVIIEVLKQDPRPVVYRGFENQEQSPYRNKHAFRLYDGDIHFRFTAANCVEVFEITV